MRRDITECIIIFFAGLVIGGAIVSMWLIGLHS